MTSSIRTLKVRENRLRRVAQRQGLLLVKSRRRDPQAVDFGTYALLDPDTKALVAGDSEVMNGYGLTLDDVEKILVTDPRELAAWHEAGHAVAAVMRGGSSLTSVTLGARHGEGLTNHRSKSFDSGFITF